MVPGSQKSPGSEKTPPRRQLENFVRKCFDLLELRPSKNTVTPLGYNPPENGFAFKRKMKAPWLCLVLLAVQLSGLAVAQLSGESKAVWNKLRKAMFKKDPGMLTEALAEAQGPGISGISLNLIDDANALLAKLQPVRYASTLSAHHACCHHLTRFAPPRLPGCGRRPLRCSHGAKTGKAARAGGEEGG